ncbi:MAG: iron-containing alcohol dehydrogenase [Firmicutes bacterium]|nr:iron-containing alcohol dehydrogenase [Bacillota bacterium]
MENFTFYSPTEFVFGKNSETLTWKLLKKHQAKKVLIHYGGGSVIRSGLLQKIENQLKENRIEYVMLGGARPNPVDSKVYEGIELCKTENIDFVLAVGGGSAIDSAKAIADGSKYEGDFWDLFDNKAKIEASLPVGVVLTIPAAGSEGSGSAVITKESLGLKRGVYSVFHRPVFAIINPELTYTLPMYQTAAGIVDMMSHIFERYLTKSTGVELTDRLSEGTLISIMEAARVIFKNPTNYDARATICWAGTIAHNGSLGVGRVEDWVTHGLEHELSALYDVTHGAGLAVMFPAYMKYTIDEDVNRYYQLATRVFGVERDENNKRGVALLGIDKLVEFFIEIGMPVTFDEIGAKKEDINFLLNQLEINRGFPVGSFKTLSKEDCRNIYLLACL